MRKIIMVTKIINNNRLWKKIFLMLQLDFINIIHFYNIDI